MSKAQCKYCNKTLKGQQVVNGENICYTCYYKRPLVRQLVKMLEPLRELSEQRLIRVVEFNIDYGYPVSPEDYKRYTKIIERRKEQ